MLHNKIFYNPPYFPPYTRVHFIHKDMIQRIPINIQTLLTQALRLHLLCTGCKAFQQVSPSRYVYIV